MADGGDILASDLKYEKLSSDHDLSNFDCSFEDELGLNEFIHEEALQFQNENMGVTYLFFYDDVIVGFATLSMSQIEIKETKIKLPFKTTVNDYPALMIGRLATDNNYRDRHVGKNISLWCVSIVKQLSSEIGCKLLIILTNEKKYAFYTHCGFDMVPKFERKSKKWLYLPVSENPNN
jgi:hypothetical protein